MQNRVRLQARIFVCALALVFCAGAVRPQGSGAPGPENPEPQKPTPVKPDWKLGSPATSQNLVIFPVSSVKWDDTSEFITLDEGLKNGSVTVSELGGGIIRGRAELQRGAEVNTLALLNNSGRTLILLGGELLVGGRQDRIVDADRLAPSSELPIALGVFCVEHGRWKGDTATFGGNRPGPTVPRTGQNFMPAPAPPLPGLPGQMANPKVREKAEAEKSQTEVWNQVNETVTDLGAKSSTGALTRIYDDKKQAAQLHSTERALQQKILGKSVVGVVVAINGQLVAADIFASPTLFQRYWPKLLSSYALEAFSAVKKPAVGPSSLNAEEFLCRVEGEMSSQGTDGVYRLTEHKTAADSSFELESIEARAPFLVHFNRIASR
jgi:hypothetical protein